MSDPIGVLRTVLESQPAAPFLFVGSGFSRRYLGLETWAGLLERFCEKIKPFGYYSTTANGNLPLAATLMAQDFNDWWWAAEETSESRDANKDLIFQRADALKVEIANYLRSFSQKTAADLGFANELSTLGDVSIDGIITTNWDGLLESIFPDYKVFVGQEELLFSNPQSIGEIYKIHGSISDPTSMVLTEEDYLEFAARNPYLAAKLVTIFVEHPIIFIGYSITDPHIQNIIMAIAKCLPQSKVEKFQENLIFVRRAKDGAEPSIEKSTLQSDGFNVTMTVVAISDFSALFGALGGRKRKIPARLLRFFKEQMYEFVRSPDEKAAKLAVVDYDQLSEADDIEFVVGVGVAQKQESSSETLDKLTQSALAKRGYEGVTAQDIFLDCVKLDSEFNAQNLLEAAYPVIARQNRTFLPVYRYLAAVGITSQAQLDASALEGAKKIVSKMNGSDFSTKYYRRRYEDQFSGMSTDDIITFADSKKDALLMLPFQPEAEVNTDELRAFLQENISSFTGEPYATGLKKLVCRYDKIKYGF